MSGIQTVELSSADQILKTNRSKPNKYKKGNEHKDEDKDKDKNQDKDGNGNKDRKED